MSKRSLVFTMEKSTTKGPKLNDRKRPKGQCTVGNSKSKSEPARSVPADMNVSVDNVKSIAANIQSRLKCRTIQRIDRKTKMENKQNAMYYIRVCFLSLSNTSGPNTIYLKLQT